MLLEPLPLWVSAAPSLWLFSFIRDKFSGKNILDLEIPNFHLIPWFQSHPFSCCAQFPQIWSFSSSNSPGLWGEGEEHDTWEYEIRGGMSRFMWKHSTKLYVFSPLLMLALTGIVNTFKSWDFFLRAEILKNVWKMFLSNMKRQITVKCYMGDKELKR